MEFIPVELILAIVAVIVIAWLFRISRPAAVFVLRIRDGKLTVRGRARKQLVSAIDDICRQNGLQSGTITALAAGSSFRLKYSKEIPQGCQQQIRNLLLSGAYNDVRVGSR